MKVWENKSDSSSNENITSTNNPSEIKLIPRNPLGNLLIKAVSSLNHPTAPNSTMTHQEEYNNYPNNSVDSRSIISSTAPSSPSNHNYESDHFDPPEVKMEVPDDDCSPVNDNPSNSPNEWKHIGDFIVGELSKLPTRKAHALKNILIRDVLKFSENYLAESDSH